MLCVPRIADGFAKGSHTGPWITATCDALLLGASLKRGMGATCVGVEQSRVAVRKVEQLNGIICIDSV